MKLVVTLIAPYVNVLTCRLRLLDDTGAPSTVRVILDRVFQGLVFLPFSSARNQPNAGLEIRFLTKKPASKNRMLGMDEFGSASTAPPQIAPPPTPGGPPVDTTAVLKLLTEQMAALTAASVSNQKATEVQTRVSTELASRAYTAVSTHDEVLLIATTPFALRQKYPRFIFSALAGAGCQPRKILGITTEQAISLYDAVVKQAEKFRGTLSTEDRKTLGSRLGSYAHALPLLLQLLIAVSH